MTKILVLLYSRKIKDYASTFNDGHWAFLGPRKKASGIKDMQPIMVASGIFVHHKWWIFLRIQPGCIPAGPWNSQGEK